MKRILTTLLSGVLALCGLAQTEDETMVFDLTQQENFNRCKQSSLQYDRSEYQAWTFSTYTGYISMYNYYITSHYYDDYLTTPDLALEPGCMYVVYYKPSNYNSGDPASNISVLLGQGSDLTSYRTIQRVEELPYGSDAPVHEATFAVEEAGNYRISFNAGPDAIYLKDAKICKRGESGVPKGVTDFTLTPDPDGALTVSISFTMPTTTLTGQALSSVKYNLYRGVQKIKNGIEATPGERVTLTENRAEAGKLIYSVEPIANGETGEKVTAETYIGPETPSAPTEVRAVADGNELTVSWMAPTMGTHGATLDPSRLSYNLVRIVDGHETSLANGLKTCSYTETLEPEGIQTVIYRVTAVYGSQAKASAPAESEGVRIGNVTLPFSDSFAGAEISPLWENQIIKCNAATPVAYHYWQALPEVNKSYLKLQSFDGDGGLLYYQSYQIQKENAARLATPAINWHQGDNPAISFAMYHYGTGVDELRVQVSCDGGEWVNVPEALFTPKGEPNNAWTVHTVMLAESIPAGTKTYRVGLAAESQYKFDICVDAVKIFNVVDKDLEVSSLVIPEVITAGNSTVLKVRVSNNGTSEVGASGYSLTIDTDYPEALEMPEQRAVPAMGFTDYEISADFNSIHAVNGPDYTFTAKVAYSGDQMPDNNELTAAVNVGYSDGVPATDLVCEHNDEGVILRWTPAKDLDYVPVGIAESFEDESFAEDSTGPFNGWVTIDLDGQQGDNWYSASGSQFNLAKNVSTPGDTKDGRNVLGVTVKSNYTQNDWIISPRLNGKEGTTMELKVLVGLKQVSSYGNNYTITLRYTTDESYSMLNPQNNFTHTADSPVRSTSASDQTLPQDNKMHELTFSGIPAEAKYVALHFEAKGSYNPAMWVDNIRITGIDSQNLLGYNVYSLNGFGRLNDELVSADAAEFVIPELPALYTQTHNVFVSAVYPDGEAVPSNFADANGPQSEVKMMPAEGEGETRWFTIDGLEVTKFQLSAGIYVKVKGGVRSKTVINRTSLLTK